MDIVEGSKDKDVLWNEHMKLFGKFLNTANVGWAEHDPQGAGKYITLLESELMNALELIPNDEARAHHVILSGVSATVKGDTIDLYNSLVNYVFDQSEADKAEIAFNNGK